MSKTHFETFNFPPKLGQVSLEKLPNWVDRIAYIKTLKLVNIFVKLLGIKKATRIQRKCLVGAVS